MAAELAEAVRTGGEHARLLQAEETDAAAAFAGAVDEELAWEDGQIADARARIEDGQARTAAEYASLREQAEAMNEQSSAASIHRGWLGDLWDFFSDLAQRLLEWSQEKLGRRSTGWRATADALQKLARTLGGAPRHVASGGGRWRDAMNWAEAFHTVGNRFGLESAPAGGIPGGAVMSTTRVGATDVVATVDDLAHWKGGHTFEEFELTMANAGRGVNRVVVRDLFARARREVLIATFAIDRGERAEALFGGPRGGWTAKRGCRCGSS